MYLLAKDIQSDDGVANECIREAALRLSELVDEVNNRKQKESIILNFIKESSINSIDYVSNILKEKDK